jgi:DNA polymerase epsilon subunit 2
LKPDSLAWLETLVEHFELLGDGDDVQDEETLAAFNDAMEKMAKGYTTDFMEESYAQIVTVDALEQVYARLQAVEGAAAGTQGAQGDAAAALTTTASNALVDGDGLDPSTYTRVIDAFDMPWLHFDGEKKTFVHHNNLTSSNANTKDGARKKPSIAGAPESRAMYLRDRYNILKQVILRNEHFSPPALPGHDRDNYMKVRMLCRRMLAGWL